MAKFQLELTEDQARALAGFCEFYSRVRCGQFDEIVLKDLDNELPVEEYCRRRDSASQLMLAARGSIYPELHGVGHSFGIGKFEDADMAHAMYKALSFALGDSRDDFSVMEKPVVRKLD